MKKTAKILGLIFVLAAVLCICAFSASAENGYPDFSPENLTAESGDKSITLSWDDDDMQGYRVFIEENGKWKTLATTEETSYTVTDIEFFATYRFAVRGYWLDGTTMRWSSSYPVISAKPLSDLPYFSPENLVAEVGFTSVTLTWADDHYRGYRVFIQENGRWKGLTTTGDTSYTITGLKEGTAYKFAVRGYWLNGIVVWCDNYPQMKVTTLGAPARPEKVDAKVNNSTAVLSWNACANATGYRVFQYVNGKWVALKTVSDTSYVVNGLKANTSYKFAVRPYFNYGGKTYWATSYTTVTAKTEKKDVLNLRESSVGINSATLVWDFSPSASGYAVYQKVNGKWNLLEICDSDRDYCRIKNLYYSTEYEFAVRSFIRNKNVDYWNSSYSYIKVKTKDLFQTDILYVHKNSADSVAVGWSTNEYASGYRAFYRELGGKWIVVGDYTELDVEFTISGLKPNTTYQFAVRPFENTSDGIKWQALSYVWSYTTEDYTIVEILKAEAQADSVVLTWTEVPGATGYRIYNKTNSGWVALETVTGTSYTLTGLESDTVYNLAVRAYKKVDGETVWYTVGPIKKVTTLPSEGDLSVYRYDAWLEKFVAEDYYFEYNEIVYQNGAYVDSTTGGLGCIGEDFYVNNGYLNGEYFDYIYIDSSGKLYLISDRYKQYTIVENLEGNEWYLYYTYLSVLGFYEHDYEITATIGEFKGMTAVCEQFYDEEYNRTYYTYYVADELIGVKVDYNTDGITENFIIESITFKPSSSMLKIPSNYTYVSIDE